MTIFLIEAREKLPPKQKGDSMKRTSMWVTLGMSFFLILSAEAADTALGQLITVTLEAIPDLRNQVQGRSPTIPMPQPKPQNFNLILPIVTVMPQSRSNSSQPESQDVLGFKDLLPSVKGKLGISQSKAILEDEEIEF
jgi:hypothetical protein